MKYRIITFLLALIFIPALPSCRPAETEDNPFTDKSLHDGWRSLSLREKIGQLVCLRYSEALINEVGNGSLEKFLEQYPVGSVFMANWELNAGTGQGELRDKYIQTIQEFADATQHPMLFVEDFEAGLGHLMPSFTAFTSEMGLGAACSEDYARQYGEIIAREARSLGINWLLHPVADMCMNPSNFLTNARTISNNADLAGELLPPQVQGIQSQHVAATAKHFPGDGTDFINQHFSTSEMKLDMDEWKSSFGLVFQALIDAGVMSIMPGHITLPAYQEKKLNDEYLPATLSHELLTGLLKEKMGFQGVIISDALNMAGISNFFDNLLETEIECFLAGVDVLLWLSLTFMDTLEVRIQRGEIPMSRLDDAVRRVWNMKSALGLFEEQINPAVPVSPDEIQHHKAIAREIAESSITLLSNKNQIIPIDPQTSPNILLVNISADDQRERLAPLRNKLESFGFTVDFEHNLSFFAVESRLDQINQQYDKLIFVFYSYPHNPWGSLSLAQAPALTMWTANMLPYDKVISIAVGDPFKNLIYMPRIWGRLNAYHSDENSLAALADALTGRLECRGKSPVN